MRRTAMSLVAASLAIAVNVAPATAVDRPISAVKLDIKNVGGKQQLTFVSKDPAALFAVPGSVDDPATGGALVELLSTAEASEAFFLPSVVGKPGWTADAAVKHRHLFTNSYAPNGISPVRKLQVKQGKVVQVLGKESGLTLAAPTTRVAVRITMGSTRNCAVFEAATFRKNEPGRLIAMKAPVPAIPDCTDASLLGMPPTCGGSTPACNGPCPSGEECASYGFDPPNNSCGCLPIGSTPCDEMGATCGGSCPGGSSCAPVSAPGGGAACGCVTSCANGFTYIGPNAEGIPPGCYPNLCSGTYPTCGGSCGSGRICSPFNAGSGVFTGCICATPAVCNAGGFECPPTEVCYINGPSAGCNPP